MDSAKMNKSKRFSEIRWYRFWRIVCYIAVFVFIIALIVLNPSGRVPVWVNLVILLVAFLGFIGPTIVHSRIIGSTEVLLDQKCDPASFVQRGDKMGLSGPIPRNGLYRHEAVWLHRYGIALSEVGRPSDAAEVRRRIEENLVLCRMYLSKRKHSVRKKRAERLRISTITNCAVLDMCLADLCARLGDAEAARAYAGQYREDIGRLPESAFSGIDRDLKLVSKVTVSSSAALFLPEGGAPEFDEADVNALMTSPVRRRRRKAPAAEYSPDRRRRLAAEALMALAKEAWSKGEPDRERRLLEQVAAAAPGMRVGKLAARRLDFSGGAGEPAGYETLLPAEAVDVHPVVLPIDEEKMQQNGQG